MTYFERVKDYCSKITKGEILACKYVKKSVKRFTSDLKKQKEEGYLYYFDEDCFNEVVEFAESIYIPDIGKNLELLDWQLFVYANLWGWRLKADKSVRRFKQAFVEVARKNSKTTSLLFPNILYDFIATQSAESYFVSADEKQAEKSYQDLQTIVKENKWLENITRSTIKSIICKENNSRIMFFSSDARSLDSYKNSLSVIDEYWNYTTDKTITAFKYGGRARKNSLILMITTAGTDIGSPCYQEVLKAKSILDGGLDDETYFSIIYEYDIGDDWKDPSLLIKSNPSIGVIVKEDVLKSDLNDALITPSHQSDYRSKTCNIWSNAISQWLPNEKIHCNDNIKIDENDLINRECTLAFDLSSINDWTAISLCFKVDGKYCFKHHFFIPEHTIEEKTHQENVNIPRWINDELLTATKGYTIDYNTVFNKISEFCQKYKVKEILYDRWRADSLIERINKELYQIPLIPIDQGLKSFSPMTKDYEKKMLDEEIVETNPIVLWMLNNVIIEPDTNGNYKPMKAGRMSNKKIDGVITAIMALNRFEANEGIEPAKPVSFSDVLNSF